jgi:glyoxylase-like metal-dependent hydrolase (beta-lactamase superfamily II)
MPSASIASDPSGSLDDNLAGERLLTAENEWTVHIIEFARSKDDPWVDLVNGMYANGLMNLPFSFVLAQRGERNVLIDTGFMQDLPSCFACQFGIPHWVSPVRMLAEFGVASDAVTDIFLTHAHFDHMGSIAAFRGAQIYIQKRELLSWYEAIALPHRFSYLTAIVDPQNLRDMLEASIEHRVKLLDGDRSDVLPGIHVRLGIGHTQGQQFVSVNTAKGVYAISGDCVYTRRQLLGHRDDGVYVPLNNAVGSVWDQLMTIDRINQEIGGDLDKLVILHDTERWKGLPVVREIEGFRIVHVA